MLRPLDAGVRDLIRARLMIDEGVVLHAYQDSLGFWTIGCGRLIDGRKGGGITAAEALYLLDNDIDRVVDALAEKWPAFLHLMPARQVVLVSMAFNLGIDGLAGFKNTLTHIWRGEYESAALGMLDSLWAKQVGVRAVRLAEMMRTGNFPPEDTRA